MDNVICLPQVMVTSIQLQRFRCFNNHTVIIDAPIVCIEGANGAGKSTFLEALFYACHIKPLTTHIPAELIMHGASYFFIKLFYSARKHDALSSDHVLEVGFSREKKVVKHDGVSLRSLHNDPHALRIVTINADNIMLITGLPAVRRSFLDEALVLENPAQGIMLQQFRKILEQRNRLLIDHRHKAIPLDHYLVWTEQLWHKTRELQNNRMRLLRLFEMHLHDVLAQFYEQRYQVALTYLPKIDCTQDSYDVFLEKHLDVLKNTESFQGRSLFGAHLDDFAVTLGGHEVKRFASRGQQKMITLLLKVAQIRYLVGQNTPPIFLLDDFFTDFDQNHGERALKMLISLQCQLFFTHPTGINALEWMPQGCAVQRILMTH